MRGMFIALMVMGAVWTGGLVWSIFGGMVLVPGATIAVGGPRVATAPAPSIGSQAKPAAPTPAVQAKPSVATAPAANTGQHGAGGHGVSHADQIPTSTKGNQILEPRIVDCVKVFDVTASVVQWE